MNRIMTSSKAVNQILQRIMGRCLELIWKQQPIPATGVLKNHILLHYDKFTSKQNL